jgi:hypothetical protein
MPGKGAATSSTKKTKVKKGDSVAAVAGGKVRLSGAQIHTCGSNLIQDLPFMVLLHIDTST